MLDTRAIIEPGCRPAAAIRELKHAVVRLGHRRTRAKSRYRAKLGPRILSRALGGLPLRGILWALFWWRMRERIRAREPAAHARLLRIEIAAILVILALEASRSFSRDNARMKP